MYASEIRELTPDELTLKLEESYQEMFNLRFQVSTGKLKDFTRIKELKRIIARLKTVERERTMA